MIFGLNICSTRVCAKGGKPRDSQLLPEPEEIQFRVFSPLLPLPTTHPSHLPTVKCQSDMSQGFLVLRLGFFLFKCF
jgi:hypothetical protein